MIKLVVIDLDGTLLGRDKEIPQQNERAIIEALESGVFVSISTGRSYVSGHKYVEQLNIDIPVSYQNGSLIVDGHGKDLRIISQAFLGGKEARELYKSARAKSLNSLVFFDFFNAPDISTVELTDTPYRGYYANNAYRITFEGNPLERITDKGIAEIAIEGKESAIIDVLGELNSNLSNMTVVKNDEIEDHAFYEFFGPGAGKHNGLKHILDYLKLDWNNVAYIGDNFNDVDILKEVGLAVVMKNAPREVQKHARVVTERTNDEGGVAQAIELILKRRGEGL